MSSLTAFVLGIMLGVALRFIISKVFRKLFGSNPYIF